MFGTGLLQWIYLRKSMDIRHSVTVVWHDASCVETSSSGERQWNYFEETKQCSRGEKISCTQYPKDISNKSVDVQCVSTWAGHLTMILWWMVQVVHWNYMDTRALHKNNASDCISGGVFFRVPVRQWNVIQEVQLEQHIYVFKACEKQ